MSKSVYTGVNDVVKGISRCLADLYPEYRRYDGNPSQEVILPCFIIEQISGRYSKRIGLREERGFIRNSFTVHFLCPDPEILREVAENVAIRLREVELPDGPVSIRAMQTSYSEEQVSITFRVRLSVSVQKEKLPLMESLDYNQRVKK